MGKLQKVVKRTEPNFSEWLIHHSSLSAALAGILTSLVTGLLSFFLATSGSPKTNTNPTTQSVFYFVGGIILLGVVIVAIAGLLRRKNRDVITLKRRLSEIYIVALKKSALNPQSHVTSND
jgi:hypothetical protein